MTVKKVAYISFVQAVELHFELMQFWNETRFGIESRDLIESALARPKNAAVYEGADIVRQAATLIFGLIKNHPWTGGNKRTASFLMEEFLFRNRLDLTASSKELLQMCLAVESDAWRMDEIESWLRVRIEPLT